MKRAIIRTLRRIASAIEAREDFPPTTVMREYIAPLATTKVAGVTVKHPPSMADEVEKMRAEQDRDIANVEVPADVIRKFQPTNPRAKPARLTPIRKPRG